MAIVQDVLILLGALLVLRALMGTKKNCPNCSSQKVYLSHRKNEFERLLSFWLIRPFRCQECHCRFWKFVTSNSQMKKPPADDSR